MYAGFVSTSHSSNWLGTHQKFDRLAYSLLERNLELGNFPSIKSIQSFEGPNGPDGLKVKSPSQNEPWHYYDPFNDQDNAIIEIINQHFEPLVKALKEDNKERAAFEASWLAHAITDGLTPAHHYPYDVELHKITGELHTERTSKKSKIIAKGDTKRQMLSRNWKLWGAKGLMLTHHGFEMGVATIALPVRRKTVELSESEIAQARKVGIEKVFKASALEIAHYHMFERFYKDGWNVGLAQDVKKVLMPIVSKTVALAWILALEQSRS